MRNVPAPATRSSARIPVTIYQFILRGNIKRADEQGFTGRTGQSCQAVSVMPGRVSHARPCQSCQAVSPIPERTTCKASHPPPHPHPPTSTVYIRAVPNCQRLGRATATGSQVVNQRVTDSSLDFHRRSTLQLENTLNHRQPAKEASNRNPNDNGALLVPVPMHSSGVGRFVERQWLWGLG
jgi:hypothetical protein